MSTSDRPRSWSNPTAPNPAAPAHVLVADDDRVTREFVAGLLRGHGMDVQTVENGQQAIAKVRDGKLDLVLLDIMMPGLDGLDTCRLIKGLTQDGFLPVLLLTSRTDADSRIAGLRIGADDYVCKPFDERELLARVNGMLRIKRTHDQVTQARVHLEELAVKDELTNLYNYRYLQTRLNEEFKRAERYHEPLACIMADIDRFKQVNDRYGHDTGDKVLQEMSERLRAAVREIDVVTRYGGEEFLLVLPSTNFSGALSVADRVQQAVRQAPFWVPDGTRAVTLSMGVAVFPSRDITSKDHLVKAADRALYQAKDEGRDRICVFQHQGYFYNPGTQQGAAG